MLPETVSFSSMPALYSVVGMLKPGQPEKTLILSLGTPYSIPYWTWLPAHMLALPHSLLDAHHI